VAGDIEKLLSSLSKSPNYMVLHFTNDTTLVKELQEFCKDSAEYRILTFTNSAKEALEKFNNSYTKIGLINPKRPKYNHPSKFYDFLFITTLPNNIDDFFKKVYVALKNGAPVFIFLDKTDKDFAYKLESILIERNFVALNLIEMDDFLVVSSKKMHGWSGS
jgi:hypothetical protein